MDQSEIQQRVAGLNTQLRFGRQQAALIEAYKLRTFIQLCGRISEDAKQELQRTEKVIAELERTRVSGVQRLVGAIVRTAKASLNPEDETEETLLDLFTYDSFEVDEDDEEDELQPEETPPEEPLGAQE